MAITVLESVFEWKALIACSLIVCLNEQRAKEAAGIVLYS
jgi:hypothetical protein